MRISVIGCGYLGAVHATAMAHIGHEVVGIDVDPAKIESLQNGVAPFFEPGLTEILQDALSSGRLRFSTNSADAAGSKVHFIAVGTPQRGDSTAADLSYVEAAVEALVPYLKRDDVVAGKSTVPVGTATRLTERVAPSGATLVWNPEFLREGWAVKDTIEPDRIVVGAPEGDAGTRAVEVLREIYAPALKGGSTPFLTTNLSTAELVKVAANAFLATKISFINAMAEIAEVTGADVTQLADAIGHDERIGRRFLGAGIGFGGGCLPKDIRAFSARADELGKGDSVAFLREIDAINLRRREHAVGLVVDALGGSVKGKRVTVLGASFKPQSDDIRDSPALDAATRLHDLGANVTVTDPEAIANAQRLRPQLNYVVDRNEALRDADAVLLGTEWDHYRRALDPVHASQLVARQIIVDGRNCLTPSDWRDAGWTYFGMGRP